MKKLLFVLTIFASIGLMWMSCAKQESLANVPTEELAAVVQPSNLPSGSMAKGIVPNCEICRSILQPIATQNLTEAQEKKVWEAYYACVQEKCTPRDTLPPPPPPCNCDAPILSIGLKATFKNGSAKTCNDPLDDLIITFPPQAVPFVLTVGGATYTINPGQTTLTVPNSNKNQCISINTYTTGKCKSDGKTPCCMPAGWIQMGTCSGCGTCNAPDPIIKFTSTFVNGTLVLTFPAQKFPFTIYYGGKVYTVPAGATSLTIKTTDICVQLTLETSGICANNKCEKCTKRYTYRFGDCWPPLPPCPNNCQDTIQLQGFVTANSSPWKVTVVQRNMYNNNIISLKSYGTMVGVGTPLTPTGRILIPISCYQAYIYDIYLVCPNNFAARIKLNKTWTNGRAWHLPTSTYNYNGNHTGTGGLGLGTFLLDQSLSDLYEGCPD